MKGGQGGGGNCPPIFGRIEGAAAALLLAPPPSFRKPLTPLYYVLGEKWVEVLFRGAFLFLQFHEYESFVFFGKILEDETYT